MNSNYNFKEIIPEYVAIVFAIPIDDNDDDNDDNDGNNNDNVDDNKMITSHLLSSFRMNTIRSHLVPIVGIPGIVRLLQNLQSSGFQHCIITISHDDNDDSIINDTDDNKHHKNNTISVLKLQRSLKNKNDPMFILVDDNEETNNENNMNDNNYHHDSNRNIDDIVTNNEENQYGIIQIMMLHDMKITIVRIPPPHMIHHHMKTSSTASSSMSITTASGHHETNNNDSKSLSKTKQSPGSVDVLRYIEYQNKLISSISNIVIIPGDLVLLNSNEMMKFIHCHRIRNQSSMNNNKTKSSTKFNDIMILLSDYGEYDDNTKNPYKETTKLKKGIGLPRNDNDIDYIAISTSTNNDIINNNTISYNHRILWKESKINVEVDIDMIGTTPKIMIPKSRLLVSNTKNTTTSIRTDYYDTHVYILPPWVRYMIQNMSNNDNPLLKTKFHKIHSIQKHLIPLLISRQFHNIMTTFTTKPLASITDIQSLQYYYDIINDILSLHQEQNIEFNYLNEISIQLNNMNTTTLSTAPTNTVINTHIISSLLSSNHDILQYTVQAYVIPKNLMSSTSTTTTPSNNNIHDNHMAIRSSKTIASYLYIHKEIMHHIASETYLSSISTTSTKQHHQSLSLLLSPNAIIKSKFHSIILENKKIMNIDNKNNNLSDNKDEGNKNDTALTAAASTTSTTTSTTTTSDISSSSSLSILLDQNKVSYKATMIGINCMIGLKCRLQNVILYNNVIIGDNVILHNVIIGYNTNIGNNCTLNDCMIQSNSIIPSGTKMKKST